MLVRTSIQMCAAVSRVNVAPNIVNGTRRRWSSAVPPFQPSKYFFAPLNRFHPLSRTGRQTSKYNNSKRRWPPSIVLMDDHRLLCGSDAVVDDVEEANIKINNGVGEASRDSEDFEEFKLQNKGAAEVENTVSANFLVLREDIETAVDVVMNPNIVEVMKGKESAELMRSKMLEKISRRRLQQATYLMAALASSIGFTTLSAAAVVYRFVWQMPASGDIPYVEIFGTFSLAVGAAIGMEYWARWAHKALWHASLWHMHESHHRPRDGPFEMNDVFAIINAVPAISLMLYGFLNKGIVPGLCFGAGLGITMFGIAYMFVHDGLVHRRFPVGPIAEVPYLQKVAAAHQLHHADLFQGVPYGLFLGPKELEEVGGEHELEKLLKQRARK